MGSEETTKSPLRGAFWDTGRTPESVDSGGEEEEVGGGGGQTGETDGREDDTRTRQDGEGDGKQIEDICGGFQLG